MNPWARSIGALALVFHAHHASAQNAKPLDYPRFEGPQCTANGQAVAVFSAQLFGKGKPDVAGKFTYAASTILKEFAPAVTDTDFEDEEGYQAALQILKARDVLQEYVCPGSSTGTG